MQFTRAGRVEDLARVVDAHAAARHHDDPIGGAHDEFREHRDALERALRAARSQHAIDVDRDERVEVLEQVAHLVEGAMEGDAERAGAIDESSRSRSIDSRVLGEHAEDDARDSASAKVVDLARHAREFLGRDDEIAGSRTHHDVQRDLRDRERSIEQLAIRRQTAEIEPRAELDALRAARLRVLEPFDRIDAHFEQGHALRLTVYGAWLHPQLLAERGRAREGVARKVGGGARLRTPLESRRMTHFDGLVDGSIVGLYLLATMIAGVMVKRYVGKVEHFLVAGREMDVYLGIASLAATEFGIVTCMYTAQAGYEYGFAGATPGILQAIAMLVIGLTGFCIEPLRASGVMTIPELFEKRFGPRVRWFAGLVIILGGLLNMGLFLRIGGEFLVVVTGFDARYLELAMTVLLAMVLVYTVLGGMLSVLVTDYLQFVVMSGGLIVVTILIAKNVGWSTLVQAVETHHGDGGFNPIVNAKLGWPYLLFQSCLQIAATLTWQPVIARLLAAKDSRTGRQVYVRTSFFFVTRFVIPGLWGIAALAMLKPGAIEAFTAASAANSAEHVSSLSGPASLYGMPLFLSTFLPIGLMGLLVAAMLAADMSTDSSYMLTWASVIYNDLLAPLRGKGWSEKKGLFWNRSIVVIIGIFLLFYGLWYPLQGDLWTYFGVTGTIYLSSMSVLLVACCYWKRANSWGAGAAIFFGAAFPIGFLVLEKLPATKEFAASVGAYWSGLAAYVVAALAMILGSLAKPLSKERAA